MTIELSKNDAVQLVRQKSREQKKVQKSVKVTLNQGAPGFLYAWGDNTLGKLGIDQRVEKVPRAHMVAINEQVS